MGTARAEAKEFNKRQAKELRQLFKELSCPVCDKVHRSPIGLKFHLEELHSDFNDQEVKVRDVATGKKPNKPKGEELSEHV